MTHLPTLETAHIAVVGLGYVGLPVATAFGTVHPTIGFDIDTTRVEELRQGRDRTREVSRQDLSEALHLRLTDQPGNLASCNIYIITVPTPIDAHKQPDLGPLRAASRSIGALLAPGDVVIYESTVYPGATEEVCVPILEDASGLTFNTEFFAGYSPERINPGDTQRRLPDIVKVTSGSTPEVADLVDALYGQIITAGTHKAASIRVAEAAKVIENTQRDVNIALVNELSLIFHRLGIDTTDVLEAAGTKWNFLNFRPGLVGGHCIGVDPYYLTHKALAVGHNPEVVLAGRRINDGMGAYVATQAVREMIQRDRKIKGAKALILGLTFKENCPDLRNTRVVDIVHELESYGVEVDVHDPWVDPVAAQNEYGISLAQPAPDSYDCVICAVGHQQFTDAGPENLRAYGTEQAVFFDLKSLFSKDSSDFRL